MGRHNQASSFESQGNRPPNVVFVLADQLRAASLPIYGEKQIQTPHLDRLASEGVTYDRMISTCPVCTPYRSMLLTGRHPQTTGHVLNFVETRWDEIGLGDAFAAAGYRTGWVGKWHLAVGGWPGAAMDEGGEGPSYIPEGRMRLGFNYWRAYDFHEEYFDGWVNKDNWRNERWKGYETDALGGYARQFLEEPGDQPFLLVVSPHQPHKTCCGPAAPAPYYDRLPAQIALPDNVPSSMREKTEAAYRDYLAMTLAVDDMLGQLLDCLDKQGHAEDTIVIFTSDHGSMFGAHGIDPWNKNLPYEESIRVPLVVRGPGDLRGGVRRDPLTAPADLFPTLCGLCGIPVPRTVEGVDLSAAWCGQAGATEQEAVLLMGFGSSIVFADRPDVAGATIQPWRGVRTHRYTFARRLDGNEFLFDLQVDPLQQTNLADNPDAHAKRQELSQMLDNLLAARGDAIHVSGHYLDWFDTQRRIVRNAWGALSHPESEPDWSLVR